MARLKEIHVLRALLVLFLLVLGVQALREPSTAMAQGTGRWKVVMVSLGDNGAQELERLLNSNINHQQVKLYQSSANQAMAVIGPSAR